MSTINTIQDLTNQEYKWGFVTSVEEDKIPKGLNEDIIAIGTRWRRPRASRNGPM